MAFAELKLSQSILRALETQGYKTPTPIQRQSIPHVLAGKDVLGCAQTGTGKTAAFALPILQRLSAAAAPEQAAAAEHPPAPPPQRDGHRGSHGRRGQGGTAHPPRHAPRKARALILAPTRELAEQISESFRTYGRGSHLDCAVVYGGVSQFHQERALRAGVDIIVATPGRLMDLMDQRIADLSGVEIFVLDEADRMLDMGFIQPIRRIAAATPPPPKRQTLLFSATMPDSILKLAHSLLRDPVRVSVDPVSSAAPKIEQCIYMVHKTGKQALLEHLLADDSLKIERALVFTKTKHGAERVGKRLRRAGVGAETIHGNRSQGQRKRALASFSSGDSRVLVATDVAARGLDVDDITHVFNYDLPMEPEAYVHRIGRTGRAGATGIAISFCDGQERSLLRDIEKLIGAKIPVRVAEGVQPIVETHREPEREERPRQARGGGRDGHRAPRGRGGHGGSHGHTDRAASRPAQGGRSGGHAPRDGHSGHSGHGTHAATSKGHASGSHGDRAGHKAAGPHAGHGHSKAGAHGASHSRSATRGWHKKTTRGGR